MCICLLQQCETLLCESLWHPYLKCIAAFRGVKCHVTTLSPDECRAHQTFSEHVALASDRHWTENKCLHFIYTGGLWANEHRAAGVNNRNEMIKICKICWINQLNVGEPHACSLLQKYILIRNNVKLWKWQDAGSVSNQSICCWWLTSTTTPNVSSVFLKLTQL